MKENKKKKIKTYALSLTAVASLLTNNTFDAVSDIIDSNYEKKVTEQYRQTQSLSYKDKIRIYLNKLPIYVRLFVLIPLWCIGFVLSSALKIIFSNMLMPLSSTILFWLSIFVIMLIVTTIVSKLIFNNIKVKDVINKKTISTGFLLLVILAITDEVLKSQVYSYNNVSMAVKLIFGFVICLIITIMALLNHQGRKLVAYTDDLVVDVDYQEEQPPLIEVK